MSWNLFTSSQSKLTNYRGVTSDHSNTTAENIKLHGIPESVPDNQLQAKSVEILHEIGCKDVTPKGDSCLGARMLRRRGFMFGCKDVTPKGIHDWVQGCYAEGDS